MSSDWGTAFSKYQLAAQTAAMGLLAFAAVGAAGATLLALVGAMPWLEVPITMGGEVRAVSGPALQGAITLLLLLLCSFLPSSVRVLRLEATHRDFSLRMDDVARAYWTAHAADREGLFTLRREYDSVRERLEFLRRHPDLEELDHGILEVAAQMSHEARELAQIYSDEKVAHAREVLALRQDQARTVSDRIARAHGVTAEMRRLLEEVETDEDVVRSRLARLRAELAELMPAIERSVAKPRDAAARRARIGVVPGE